jgi:hypothetical protein
VDGKRRTKEKWRKTMKKGVNQEKKKKKKGRRQGGTTIHPPQMATPPAEVDLTKEGDILYLERRVSFSH